MRKLFTGLVVLAALTSCPPPSQLGEIEVPRAVP
jgi:hypothetical protein